MSLLERMKSVPAVPVVPVVKPRYRLVDGEWELKAPKMEKCEGPVVGQACPKCLGNQLVQFHDGRTQMCYWCTDGRGVISVKDKRNFDRRMMQKQTMCFIRTVAA